MSPDCYNLVGVEMDVLLCAAANRNKTRNQFVWSRIRRLKEAALDLLNNCHRIKWMAWAAAAAVTVDPGFSINAHGMDGWMIWLGGSVAGSGGSK